MKITKTQNYEQFKFINENRKIDNLHVSRLKRVIAEKNKSLLFPIVVNTKMEIIDGQHRFEALKQLKLPIYYIIDDSFELKDIMTVNTNSKLWNTTDYLEFYIAQEIIPYIVFKNLMDKYKFNLTEALYIIGDINLHGTHKLFKEGKLQLKSNKEIEYLCPYFFKLKHIFKTCSRDLINSILYLKYNVKEVNLDLLLKKLEEYKKVHNNDMLYVKSNIYEQTVFFEDVYNYRLKNTIKFADRKRLRKK